MKRGRAIAARVGQDIRSYGGFVLLFLLYDLASHLLFGAFCPYRILTGLPCPGCGMTRSVVCFALGQFSRGWQYSPLGIFWLLLALYFCVARYLLGKPAKGLLPAAGVLIGMMIVFYLYRMYRFFPGEVPMEYTRGNLLERVIPGYFGLLQEMLGRLRALGAAYFG